MILKSFLSLAPSPLPSSQANSADQPLSPPTASGDAAKKVAEASSPAFSQLQRQLSSLRILHEQEGGMETAWVHKQGSAPWCSIAPKPARPAAATAAPARLPSSATSLSAVRSPAVHKLLMELVRGEGGLGRAKW